MNDKAKRQQLCDKIPRSSPHLVISKRGKPVARVVATT